jgi:hypothetical protein
VAVNTFMTFSNGYICKLWTFADTKNNICERLLSVEKELLACLLIILHRLKHVGRPSTYFTLKKLTCHRKLLISEFLPICRPGTL